MNNKKFSIAARALVIFMIAALVLNILAGTGAAVSLSNSGGGAWKYQRDISIKENSGTTLTDYQVLVELKGADFPGEAQSGGADIRFTDTSGNELSYWIESWDYAEKSAKIWVKMLSIRGNGITTMRLYYGNPSASSSSNGDATFELFDEFEGASGNPPNTSKWLVFKDTYGIAELDGTGRLKIASKDTGEYGHGYSNVYTTNNIGKDILMEYKWQMGTMWEWYPNFYGYIQASGMPKTGIDMPSNAYLSGLDSHAQYPNKANNMVLGTRYNGATVDYLIYDIIPSTTVFVRFASLGNNMYGWISYDGNNWVNVGSTKATNELNSGRVGFEGGSEGDRQNDNRVEYVRIRKYTSSEPTLTIEQPTETPTPTTPAPTTPAPTTPTPCPKSASVNLHGEKTDVVLGDDILLKLSAVSLITKPKMHVQVIIIPPSGMSVTSSEFSKSGAGQFTSNYELEPGDGRDIEIRIKSNQVGDFDVTGRVVYYFGDEKDKGEDCALNLPIKVKEIASTPGSIQNTGTKVPGFEIILAGVGMILALSFRRR